MPGIAEQLKIQFMYLAIEICICYNAGRQTKYVFHKNTKIPRVAALGIFYSYFKREGSDPQAGYRLLVAIQPLHPLPVASIGAVTLAL